MLLTVVWYLCVLVWHVSDLWPFAFFILNILYICFFLVSSLTNKAIVGVHYIMSFVYNPVNQSALLMS